MFLARAVFDRRSEPIEEGRYPFWIDLNALCARGTALSRGEGIDVALL
jgi:hypothetical protein